METPRRRINGDIQAGAEKRKKHPKRRASAQKLLSRKAPENEIMQDTRGEALTSEPPGTTRNARDNAQVPRQRTEIEHQREARDHQRPPETSKMAPRDPEDQKGSEMKLFT